MSPWLFGWVVDTHKKKLFVLVSILMTNPHVSIASFAGVLEKVKTPALENTLDWILL